MNRENPPRYWWYRVILLLLLLIAFGLRLHELTKQNIWWDEARNIDVALRPFWQIPTAPELDIHPPIYFWLLHLWSRLLGLGDSTQQSVASLAEPPVLTFIVRSLSAFVNVLSVALTIHLVRLWPTRFAKGAALLVGIVTALSPFWLAESQETRMYTVSFTLLLLAAVHLIMGVRSPALQPPTSKNGQSNSGQSKNGHNRRALALFTLFSALALLTHYNALFIVVSWYLWWGGWAILQPNRWLWFRRVIGYGLLMTLLVLPIAPIALRQIPGYSNPNLTVPTIFQYLSENWQAYLGGYAFSPDWFSADWFSPDWLASAPLALDQFWLWGIALIAGVGLLACGWQTLLSGATGAGDLSADSPRLSQMGYLSFMLVWIVGGLGLYYIAIIDRGAFNPRYSSFITPALYGIIALGLVSWPVLRIPMALVGTAFIVIGFGPTVYADIYDDRFAREDMVQTTQWLREEAGTNDIIFVDQKYPFGFYYDRFVIDAQQEYPAGTNSPARYLFVDINTIDQKLTQWATEAERIFWLQWFESDTDPRGSVTFLLDKAGTWSGEKHFRGYTVDWWTLRPPNQFVLATDMEAATYIFPPAVETVELSVPKSAVAAGEDVPIVVRWKRVTEGWTDRPLKARVAIYRPGENSRLGQNDRPVLNDRHLMPSEWSPADQPLNVYAVPLPTDLSAGIYEARLMIYDAETLEPLTYVDMAGNPAGIEAVIGEIAVR